MKKELQRIIRREFDRATSYLIARDIIEIARRTTFDDEPLDPRFIQEMFNDLKP